MSKLLSAMPSYQSTAKNGVESLLIEEHFYVNRYGGRG